MLSQNVIQKNSRVIWITTYAVQWPTSPSPTEVAQHPQPWRACVSPCLLSFFRSSPTYIECVALWACANCLLTLPLMWFSALGYTACGNHHVLTVPNLLNFEKSTTTLPRRQDSKPHSTTTNKQTNKQRASERAKTRNGKESSVLLQSVVNALISHLSSSQLTKLATLTFMDCFSIFIPALHFSLLTTSWTVSPCSFLHYTLVYWLLQLLQLLQVCFVSFSPRLDIMFVLPYTFLAMHQKP